MAELVRDHETGLLFEAGNPQELAQKLCLAKDNPEEMRRMGENARREYENRYSPTVNYLQLIAIYEDAIREASRVRR
jgi:glycosyltransferase involved in cell wall biosynthesis